MKFSAASLLLGCAIPATTGFSQTLMDQYNYREEQQTFIGNSMWLFSKDGVYVFSPDGSTVRAHTPKELVCEDPDTFEGPSYKYCRFNDVVSDGKRYVWAGTSRQESSVSVFDIDTGALVGMYQACKSPHDLEFHPLRDEIWIRCTDIDNEGIDPTHLDVISASNPSGEIKTNILAQERALQEGVKSSGYSVIAPELGDVGYITDDSNSKLFQVDLSNKNVIDAIELSPAAYGLYEASFLPENKHLYVRAIMCCTCGTPESDREGCRRDVSYPVSPTTGKSAGVANVTGVCGRDCSGIAGVDTIGVYEIDSKTNKVVATHALAEGIGGDPYPSPDGKYIVLMGKNGGKTVRVLQAGEEGSPSSVLVDLKLDFNRTGYEDKSVARDFAFVNKDGKTLLVMPSGTSHKVAIVDFTNNFSTTYVTFSDKEFFNTAPHGRYRSVEWAVGTDYVWTNDSKEDEHYVIDVMQGKLIKTITGIPRSSMLSVQNWERVHQNEKEEAMKKEIQAMQEEAMKNLKDETLKAIHDGQSGDAQGPETGLRGYETEGETKDESALVVAAIIVASLALIVGVINLAYMNSMNNKASTNYPSHSGESQLPIEKLNDPRNDPMGVST